MITSILMGGLGNQLFQIATATNMAINNGAMATFSSETHMLENQGNHASTYQDNIFRNISLVAAKIPYSNLYREPSFEYQKIEYTKDSCLFGYFQSEKYFSENEKAIRELFTMDRNTSEYLAEKYGHLFDGPKKLVSVHVRRGDYLRLSEFHHVCTLDYYKKAMEKFSDVIYVVFSDDLMWCKLNLPLGEDYVFAEGNKDFQDLYLMSLCDHHIIANSSFSWWGAWLNESDEKKVIAPRKWFGPKNAGKNTKDLYCEGWELL